MVDKNSDYTFSQTIKEIKRVPQTLHNHIGESAAWDLYLITLPSYVVLYIIAASIISHIAGPVYHLITAIVMFVIIASLFLFRLATRIKTLPNWWTPSKWHYVHAGMMWALMAIFMRYPKWIKAIYVVLFLYFVIRTIKAPRKK